MERESGILNSIGKGGRDRETQRESARKNVKIKRNSRVAWLLQYATYRQCTCGRTRNDRFECELKRKENGLNGKKSYTFLLVNSRPVECLWAERVCRVNCKRRKKAQQIKSNQIKSYRSKIEQHSSEKKL